MNTKGTTKLASLELVLDSELLHGGDIIEGVVRVKVTREILVRNIRVAFYGECTYKVFDESLCTSKLWQRSNDLWRGVPYCYLPPGSYSYRFALPTPVSIPSSFDCGHDSILNLPSTSRDPPPIINHLKYYIEVRIIEHSSNVISEHVKRKEIRIEGVCLEWPDSNTDTNVAREVGYVRNVLDASGSIGVTMKLNKGWSLPGSCVYCNVEVLNCFRKLHVELRLIERFVTIAKGAPFTSKQEEVVVYSRTLGNVKSGEAYRRWLGVDCWIPEDTIAWRERDREDYGDSTMAVRISRGIFVQLRVKSGLLSHILSIALPIWIVPDVRYLPRRLRNGTRLSGAATI